LLFDVYTSRVGRTGRAGDKEGVAVTLLLEGVNRDTHFAGLLVNSLTLGGQEVPRSLYALAMKVRLHLIKNQAVFGCECHL
jgi:ATP-dependent RNA helicase DDX42